jgi:hypothetical protein
MPMTMFKEHDMVTMKRSIKGIDIPVGSVGTIIHVYKEGLAYEVEFPAKTVSVDKADISPMPNQGAGVTQLVE